MNKVLFLTTVLFFAATPPAVSFSQVLIQDVDQTLGQDVDQSFGQGLSEDFDQDLSKDLSQGLSQDLNQEIDQGVGQGVGQNTDRDLGFSHGSVFKQIEFDSADGLKITADLYMAYDDKSKPFIVLCHQAGWSRGEYREIAPKLNNLGFNCMAIDQRSGGKVDQIINETAARAKKAGKSVTFVDAEPDIVAAAKYAKENFAEGKLLLWGSSYSSALVLRIAGEHTELVDGTLSFSPGEYFARLGKPRDWIASSAKKVQCPVFITSAKDEAGKWKPIFEAITVAGKTSFVPTTKGNHGSRALWDQFKDSGDYWKATKIFLKRFL